MRAWLCKHRTWTWWRVRIDMDLGALPWPMLQYGHGGAGWRWVNFSLQPGSADEVFGIEINLGDRR